MIEEQFELLQNLIDRCVKHNYNAVKESFSMKKEYLKGEQRPDFIRKEIFRVTEELVSMKQKIPALQSFAFDWHNSNFIWDSAFFENLTFAERKKYIAFHCEDFNDKQYFENPVSYDESLPYFSFIVKLVVYSRYLEDLQKEEQEREEQEQALPSANAIEVVETTPKKIVGKENPFNCNLNKEAIQLLTDCVNETHIFTTEITSKILNDFLYCSLDGALKSNNNRLLAYFMTQLSLYKHITFEWQSVIANNKLVLAPMKKKYLNNSDLSTANDNIKYIAPKKSEIIDKYIKELKKH